MMCVQLVRSRQVARSFVVEVVAEFMKSLTGAPTFPTPTLFFFSIYKLAINISMDKLALINTLKLTTTFTATYSPLKFSLL